MQKTHLQPETEALLEERATRLTRLCQLMNQDAAVQLSKDEEHSYTRDMQQTLSAIFPLPRDSVTQFDFQNPPKGLRITRANNQGQLEAFLAELKEIYPQSAGKMQVIPRTTMQGNEAVATSTATLEITDPDVVAELGRFGFKALGLSNETGKGKGR